MIRIGIELREKIPEYDGLEVDRADEDELLSGLLETDGAVELLLYLEGLVEVLQFGDEVQDGGDDEEEYDGLAWPGNGEVVSVAHCAHRNHHKPERVKEVRLDVVAEQVMDHAHPE